MLTKERVLEAIKAMPGDGFENIDVLLEQLVVWNKIERGLKDVEEGNVISMEDFEKEVNSWFR